MLTAAFLTRFGTRWPQIYYMTGPSMEPTIGAGGYFIAWSPAEWRRGALVIFRFVDEDGEFHVLRRLVGLPGDTVGMVDGAVTVGGRVQPWPFRIVPDAPRASPLARTADLLTWGPWVVPPDSVLLLSDRRDMMGWPDGRFIGFVPRDDVLARATRRLTGGRLR